jgi:lambda repressor-like predicted transcriptional regulator|tara:strand:+ start:716 stop:943 length:228 start_codon:yes stop_codon:yes gene_type:complete
MKITNSEYDTIIRALDCYSDYAQEADTLKNKLVKEYDRLAEKNMAEGMTADEEELYPSRLHTEYGGIPNDNQKVE